MSRHRIWLLLCLILAPFASAMNDPFDPIRAALAQNHLDEAESLLMPLVADPKASDARAWLYLSQVRARQRRMPEAVKLAERAVAAAPKSAECESNLGGVLSASLSELNFMQQAMASQRLLRAFQQSIRLDPDHVPGYLGLARYYTHAPSIGGGSREKAEGYAREVEKRDAFAGEMELAAIAEHFEDREQAANYYSQAVKRQPQNAQVAEKLAQARREPSRPHPGTSAPKTKWVRTEGVTYGRDHGVDLTLDVFRPEKTNGAGVISIVSGGFNSSRDMIHPDDYESYLSRGYTVFAVTHGSQPHFVIPEIVPQIQKAVQFIWANAKQYGVSTSRLGITGTSSGGFLCLTIGTRGIDNEGGAVAAGACFCPPSDFVNYGAPGRNVLDIETGVMKELRPVFGPAPKSGAERESWGRSISPVYYIDSHTPPTLIMHGDADDIVPLQQSIAFVQRATELGAMAKLTVKRGEGHVWADMRSDTVAFADWFDQYLK